MKLDEIKELLEFLEKKHLKHLRLKKGDFELDVKKEDAFQGQTTPPTAQAEVQEKPQPQQAAKAPEAQAIFIKAPMVGTFYNSPSPDQPPFVKVGDHVDEGTVVCIVEAMKVMNEVKAGKKGTIAEIYAENAQPVEYGSKLFRIE
jgi:acetyl-CoA carboxylase biotin carboxyl carrier protein